MTDILTGVKPRLESSSVQGFVEDVGDLMKLVRAKAGARPAADPDRQFSHELSDCRWSVLVLAELYGVDLAKEFPATMTEIQAKLAHRP